MGNRKRGCLLKLAGPMDNNSYSLRAENAYNNGEMLEDV